MARTKAWPLLALAAAGAGVLGLKALAEGALPLAAAPRADHAAERAEISAPSALMLSVEIDHAGVRVLQALEKPGLLVRAPRCPEAQPFRWTLADSSGRALAEGAFDPGPVDLDPAHAGEPPIVAGDTITPRRTHANVKIPDLRAEAAVLRFARRDSAGWITCGEIAISQLDIR